MTILPSSNSPHQDSLLHEAAHLALKEQLAHANMCWALIHLEITYLFSWIPPGRLGVLWKKGPCLLSLCLSVSFWHGEGVNSCRKKKEEEEEDVERRRKRKEEAIQRKNRTTSRLYENGVSHYGKLCASVGRDRREQGQQTRKPIWSWWILLCALWFKTAAQTTWVNNPYGTQNWAVTGHKKQSGGLGIHKYENIVT